MDIKAAIESLDALSHESRLEAYRLLVRSGADGLPAGAVADTLEARQNTMSSHLKQLQQAGLIRSERDGRSVVYYADFERIRELVMFLLEDCCAGSDAVCKPVAASLVNSLNQEPIS